MPKKLGNYKGNDVELCRTLNRKVGEQAAMALMDGQVPVTRNSLHIPFFLRDRYHGARRIWVISTSPRRYSQARKILDSLDTNYRRRLVVSNY